MTHELKTPLTSIRGFIELLKSGDRDEETRQYFYDVLDIEAERLHHLIDDMLVLSQIENAKDDVQTVPCNLNQEIETVLRRAKPIAEKNGIVLRLEAEEAFLVASSPTRLQQLFGNLVENAIKYNKPPAEYGAGQGQGYRHRDSAGAPAPAVRAVLPGGFQPLPRNRRHRLGLVYREAFGRPVPRRRQRGKRGRGGIGVHRQAALIRRVG